MKDHYITEIEGFIGYFDLLGFSESIRSGENFIKKISKYNEILYEAVEVDSKNLEYVFFSDSVIINSKGKSEEELIELIWALSEILYRLLIELNVVICGCISIGKFTKIVDDNNNVMITGSPILEAVHYEKKKNRIG